MPEETQEQTAVERKPKFSAESAHEVGLPSPEAINFMTSVVKLVYNGALITKDMMIGDWEQKGMRESGWTPEAIAERNEEYVKSNAMSKMLVGRGFGLDPIESLQEIVIVKGKVYVQYPTLIRELEKRGLKPAWIERSNTRAALQITKPGREPEVYEFTIQDAEIAGLLERGRDNKPGMYEKRPRTMLASKAAREAYSFSGGKANVYTDEERHEIEQSEKQAEADERALTVVERVNPFVSPERMKEETKSASAETTTAKTEPEPAKTETTAPKTETKTEPLKTEPKAETQAPEPAKQPEKALESAPAPAQDAPAPKSTRKAAAATTKAPAPAPVATEPTPEGDELRDKLKARMGELTDPFPKLSPTIVAERFGDFFRGLLDFDGPPARHRPAMWNSIPLLEGAVRAHRATFESGEGCRALGVKVADTSRNLMKLADEIQWPGAIGSLLVIANAKYMDPADDADCREWVMDVVKLDQMALEDVSAFLRACVSNNSTAIGLKSFAVQSGHPLHLVVEWVEKFAGGPVEALSPQDFTKALAAAQANPDKIANAADPADPFGETGF